MAARRKQGKPTPDGKMCDVVFEGIIPTSVRAKLVAELLKYVVYQRQQIPLPFDQIKQDSSRREQEKHNEIQNAPMKGKSIKRMDERKREHAIAAMEKIFEALDQIFMHGSQVKEVLILVGATIVSPIELYEVHLPVSLYDGVILSFRACMATLFRGLVGSDLFREVKELKSKTKLTVMVRAAKNLDTAAPSVRLIPRVNFKVPSRGRRFVLNFFCQAKVVDEQLSKLDETEFNMSGIEPLELSHTDLTGLRNEAGTPGLCNGTLTHCFTPSGSVSEKTVTGLNAVSKIDHSNLGSSSCKKTFDDDVSPSELDNSSHSQLQRSMLCHEDKEPESRAACNESNSKEDFIWYQIPVSVQGYKDRISHTIAAGDMFL